MASVRKRGKHWYVIYRDIAGKQKWVKGYTDKAQTQRLASTFENEKVAIRSGEIDPQHVAEKRQRALGIESQITDYEAALNAKGNTDGHVTWIIRNIRQFVTWSGVTRAGEIERSMVDRWVLELEKATNEKTGKPDSPKTINDRVASLQQFLRHLHNAGGVTKYVLANYPKRHTKGHERRIYRVLNEDETALLLKDCADADRKDLYQFALGSGFRLNECRTVTPASLDFKHRTISISAKDAKAKNRHQVVPMHQALVEMLQRRCEGKAPTDPIFVVPSVEHAARTFRADCAVVGIDTKNVAFHSMRHSFCTRIARTNVNPKLLMTLARHADLSTTLRYYVGFTQKDERAVIDGLPL